MGGGSGVANDVGVGCGVLSGKLRLRGHRAVGFSASIGQLLTLIIEISRRETACGNHVIAKVLVSTAERTGRGIALENLTHIRAGSRPAVVSEHACTTGRSDSFAPSSPTKRRCAAFPSWPSIRATQASAACAAV
jgi:hypothetical protein